MTKFRRWRKFLLLLCGITFIVGLIEIEDADARKKRRRRGRARTKRRAVINEPNLYERIGGSKVVAQLVDDWVRSALADGRLSGAWGNVQAKPEAVVNLRKNLNAQLCELAEGPCKSPKNEAAALDEEKFVVFADHLAQVMNKNKVREREKNEMLGRYGEVRSPEEDEATE